MLICCTEVWVQVKRYITADNLFSVVEALLLWNASMQRECTWHSAYVHKVLGVKGEEGKKYNFLQRNFLVISRSFVMDL